MNISGRHVGKNSQHTPCGKDGLEGKMINKFWFWNMLGIYDLKNHNSMISRIEALKVSS